MSLPGDGFVAYVALYAPVLTEDARLLYPAAKLYGVSKEQVVAVLCENDGDYITLRRDIINGRI